MGFQKGFFIVPTLRGGGQRPVHSGLNCREENVRPRYNIILELNIDIAKFCVSIAVPFGVACWAAWQEMESACALYTRSIIVSQ